VDLVYKKVTSTRQKGWYKILNIYIFY